MKFKKTKIFNILPKKIPTFAKIGLIVLFFLLPSITLASPISKDIVINLTNKERNQNDLGNLTNNPQLDQIALSRARDIIEKQYFSHTSPDGTPFYKWIDDSGYNYIYAGENLAINFTEVEKMITAWMESPTHKDNILSTNYTEIGIGIATGSYEKKTTIVVAQIFGRPFISLINYDRYLQNNNEKFGFLIKGAEKTTITPLSLEDNNDNFLKTAPPKVNEPQIYNINSNDTYPKNNDNKIKKFKSILNNERTDNNFLDLDIFLLITFCIFILSIIGSIIEWIKFKNNYKPETEYDNCALPRTHQAHYQKNHF